ncbi:ketoacyl-ACP synthase III family protein [Saccharopolyspora erythraea]|uniref:ketoacyl-ACP synthase III family protein n=1 Tax=Saccharopolyspora erythraea TaxID=1836 RepID=UPI00201130D9|nr:ketoacyl-ACP synthase III family protein [Saccharopolyspora erythraea]
MKTPLYISGLGSHLPDVMSAERAVELGLYDPEDYEWYGWTGATVAGDLSAPDMAVLAAREAIERSGRAPHDIDLHMHSGSWKQGPVGWSAHQYVLRNITDRDIPSYNVWQACNGTMSGMELAASYLMAVPERTEALLTGADNLGTPDFNRWSFGLQNGVLGDGATAVLLSKHEGFARLMAIKTVSTSDLEHLYRGEEPLVPTAIDNRTKVDFRERMAAVGEGAAVEWMVTRQGDLRAETALATLAEAGIGPEDVTRVTHVFTARDAYLKVILDPIGVDPDKGLGDFGHGWGHLTVNDQIMGLEHLVETGQVGPGDHVLMVGHGGGTTITIIVVRIEYSPAWSSRNPSPANTTQPAKAASGTSSYQRIRIAPNVASGQARLEDGQ